MTIFTKNLRFKNIFNKAQLIDEKISTIPSHNISEEQITSIIFEVFPEAILLGKGRQKIAYSITANHKKVVLKVIKNKNRINVYTKAYTEIEKSQKQRNRYFVKHYWITNTCILQKIAQPINKKDQNQKIQIREIRKRFKPFLSDLKNTNLGVIKNIVKILDADLRRNHPSSHYYKLSLAIS